MTADIGTPKTQTTISELVTALLIVDQFGIVTREAVKKLVTVLRDLMDAKCSDATASKVANALAGYPQAESASQLRQALTNCPEWVAKRLPKCFETEELPRTAKMVSFLARENMYGIECIIAAAENVLLLRNSDGALLQSIDQQKFAAAITVIRNFGAASSRHAPDLSMEPKVNTYVNADVFNAYKEYQLMMLGEGGQCRY